ncbi:MAG: hypothetical protein U7126_12020 [Microcoleus sp.]
MLPQTLKPSADPILCPTLRTTILPDTGHWLMLDAPETNAGGDRYLFGLNFPSS